MQRLEYSGIWWLPETEPDSGVFGTLSYDPATGAELKLFGAFAEDSDELGLGALTEREIILGRSEDGARITLTDCLHVGEKHNFSGLITSRFKPNVVLVGAFFASREDIKFRRMGVSFEHLAHWADRSGLTMTFEALENRVPHKLTATYEAPPPVVARFCGVELRCVSELTQNMDLSTHIHWDQRNYLVLQSQHDVSVEEALTTYIYHLRNLITLGVGEPTYPTSLYAVVTDTSGSGPRDRRVYIYYRIGVSPQPYKETDRRKELFKLPEISDSLDTALENWFNRYESLKPVYDLYFGTIFSSSMYLEQQLLSFMQALETYHRRVHPGTYLAKSRFRRFLRDARKFIKGTQEDIPEAVREVFCSKAGYFNEYTQRTRLTQLLKELGAATQAMIPDPDEFVQLVVNTRNYFTHYGSGSKQENVDVEQVYRLVRQLQFLLEIVFLKEIGLSGERLSDLAKTRQRYLRMRREIGIA